MINPLLSVGIKKGEMDFAVSGAVGDLSYEQMRAFREMLVVGIWVCESTWRRVQDQKNAAQQANEGAKKGTGGV